jgi:hypothetical protein
MFRRGVPHQREMLVTAAAGAEVDTAAGKAAAVSVMTSESGCSAG